MRPPLWSLLLGLAVPAALVVLSRLAGPERLYGISAQSWCLFACAPLTSLALAICWRFAPEERP
jgi:hypothetical protein